ncbi:MAG: methyltransferase [Syntrophus sp. (in: bacteria)]|nr:methyltransferase [Syntrophus sp. (in: bacteria)]
MKYRELFKVEGLPVLQNRLFLDRDSAKASPKGNVILVQDIETGLIFNSAFDAALLKYNSDYQNEQACSGVFRKHLDEVKDIIQRHFHNKPLIEVGCGKGFFLEFLRKEGYQITGVDPAYEGKNQNVIRACFDDGLGISAEGIVLRHVLEHMPDPVEFLSRIAKANGGKGLIYIEVPCFDWICRKRAWFDIYYEHVNYFRLADFRRIFGNILDCGHVFGGQYLYIVADIVSLKKPFWKKNDQVYFPSDFLVNVKLLAASAKEKVNAIWGGASKGVVFALYMEKAGVAIDLVIDINPAKQGNYLPISGLKVSTPDEAMNMLQAGDNIFVMNSNYLNEIIDLSNNKYHYIKVD